MVNEDSVWQKLIKQFYNGKDLVIKKQKLNEYDGCLFELDIKTLDLSDNLYEYIDERIYKMQKLQNLVFNNNRIKVIENGVVYLNNLQTIQMQKNMLTGFMDNVRLKNNQLR